MENKMDRKFYEQLDANFENNNKKKQVIFE